MEFSYKNFKNYLESKEYYNDFLAFLDYEYSHYTIYPERENIFSAFNLLDGLEIKVVIIGQDPYFNFGQAHGLAFSVQEGVKLPPSLVNIYKEIEKELGIHMNFKNGNLNYLAKQGVLLVNPILTVREKEPLSHNNKIYKDMFIDILKYLDIFDNPICFFLWGNKAQVYKKYILNKNRLIIETSHPSPLGANKGGWFNSGCFIKCNEYLLKNYGKSINWSNSNKIYLF